MKLEPEGGAGFDAVPLAATGVLFTEALLARSTARLPQDISADPTNAAPVTSWAVVTPEASPLRDDALAAVPVGRSCCWAAGCEFDVVALGMAAASAIAFPAQLIPVARAACTRGFLAIDAAVPSFLPT